MSPNACRAPAVPPLTHAFVWAARALGATRPWAVPGRVWTEDAPIDRELLSDRDGPDAWLPAIEHVPQELVWLLRSAGFRDVRWRTTGPGASPLPLLDRLGARVVVEARLDAEPVSVAPPLGIWPGATGGSGG